MTKNPDGTVTLTEAEAKSLHKVVASCHTAISSLASDGDFLGWDNYRALQMWDDKLKGDNNPLDWYIDDGKKRNLTVDEWLASYGKAKKGGK